MFEKSLEIIRIDSKNNLWKPQYVLKMIVYRGIITFYKEKVNRELTVKNKISMKITNREKEK